MPDWKYDVEEVGEDAESAHERTLDIEPGSPSLENVLFVLLGVFTTLLVFASIIGVV